MIQAKQIILLIKGSIYLNFRSAVGIIILIDCYLYLPTPPLRQDMTQGQFLSGV